MMWQLDNYDFCFFPKKKFNIKDLEYSNISKILETKEGYCFAKGVK